ENRGVNVVESTVDQSDFEVDHREACHRARVHHGLDAFFDAGDVFLRNRTTNDFRLERVTFARLGRGDDQLHACKLAGTTGLFFVRVVDLSLLRDGFAISHLRSADIRLNFELATHTVNEDVEVKFAHALHDGLTGLEVGL